MIIAVDFDGTVVEHVFPKVGREVPNAVAALRLLVENGHSLILWTMRSGKHLEDAVAWYSERKIPLFGINTNPTQASWTTSPKAYAQVYIDDAALGCPLIQPEGFARPCVCWTTIMVLLHNVTIH